MRRYAMLQKARDADVFGILVGTLGVSKLSIYFPIHASSDKFASILSLAHKAYTRSSRTETKEKLYHLRWQAQPSKASQLFGN